MNKYRLYRNLQGSLNDAIAKGQTYFDDTIKKFVPWPLNTDIAEYNLEDIYNIETDIQTTTSFDWENFDILIFYKEGNCSKIKDDDLKYYTNMVEIYVSNDF